MRKEEEEESGEKEQREKTTTRIGQAGCWMELGREGINAHPTSPLYFPRPRRLSRKIFHFEVHGVVDMSRSVPQCRGAQPAGARRHQSTPNTSPFTLHSRPSAARAETVANVFDCEARQARERDGKVNRERSDCGRKGG